MNIHETLSPLSRTRDVPLPKARGRYAILDELEPGESILFPYPVVSLQNAMYARKKKTGKCFTSRAENGQFIRVWRVS
jgi:hypothetical protein